MFSISIFGCVHSCTVCRHNSNAGLSFWCGLRLCQETCGKFCNPMMCFYAESKVVCSCCFSFVYFPPENAAVRRHLDKRSSIETSLVWRVGCWKTSTFYHHQSYYCQTISSCGKTTKLLECALC